MFIKKQFTLIIIIILIGLDISFAVDDNKLKVTYIANEGFLLEGADKKILIDALFGKKELNFCDIPLLETLNKILTLQAPFDDVDLLLVTHCHVDHFDASVVVDYLENNKHYKMIGIQQAVDKIMEIDIYHKVKEHIHSITPPFGQSEKINLNGVKIIVLRLKHCTYFVTDKKTGEKIDRHRNM